MDRILLLHFCKEINVGIMFLKLNRILKQFYIS